MVVSAGEKAFPLTIEASGPTTTHFRHLIKFSPFPFASTLAEQKQKWTICVCLSQSALHLRGRERLAQRGSARLNQTKQ